MKTKYIATAVTAALLSVGLVPLASAARPMPEGIEVITVAATHAAPEGIEVITVVGKRLEPTLASSCVNEVVASRVPGDRASVRQAIRACIEQARSGTSPS